MKAGILLAVAMLVVMTGCFSDSDGGMTTNYAQQKIVATVSGSFEGSSFGTSRCEAVDPRNTNSDFPYVVAWEKKTSHGWSEQRNEYDFTLGQYIPNSPVLYSVTFKQVGTEEARAGCKFKVVVMNVTRDRRIDQGFCTTTANGETCTVSINSVVR